MAPPFNPLAPQTHPASPVRTACRLQVIAADAAVFQPLAARKPVSPASASATDAVAASSAPASSGAPSAPNESAKHSAPTVELVRDGDRVSKIQIRCACGEMIELECE